ncbi:heavy-metal-associated domain-containing protein [Streptomyces sp. JJ66]|uniref:heavy-metal-associated domain-containing protein n=1 Tax=Streptomyces sp. JJ66 TaxID=2803843 RepID=UPI001C59C3EC|nr:heavy-metal-associated domain-containing protein [Streptomyces sp. JJ66]MBW1603831.1 heavy-metal-associated domain-containing protein [Streptomyces sp. JJ66]
MTSCCTPEESHRTGSAAPTTATEGTAARETVYAVAGMSCGHCEATLVRELGALEHVGAVKVDVAAGRVAVTTSGEPDDALLARVVDEAGYELTGRA